MDMDSPVGAPNTERLHLHVPEPTGRPGHATDFSFLHLAPGSGCTRPWPVWPPKSAWD